MRAVIADRAWRDAAVVLAFGITLGIMNYSIYQSFARIPLGVAVTIEFLGPLAVAVASSRRLVDGAWVLLAGANLLYLVMLGIGGVLFPLAKFPAGIQPVLRALPAGALSDGLRAALGHGAVSGTDLLVLVIWAAAAIALAARFFRWE